MSAAGAVPEANMARKGLMALGIVLVLTAIFAFCVVSAMQLLEPRHMPFGVTGPSAIIAAVQEKDPEALTLIEYSSEEDLTAAAARGDIYGGYIPGDGSDTVVTVPAKSFFGEIYVRGTFADAAKKAGREMTTTVVAPLPTYDRTGAVVGLLMLPTLIGGYLIATMLFAFTQRAAVAGRIGIILGFSILIALITGAAAVVTGAVPFGSIWTLLPCFALVTASVALPGVVLQHLERKMGTLLIALFFIIIGGSGAGGVGVSLLPDYWQTIGLLFPPRHAVELYRNVLYFGGSNIVLPIAVLGLYALAGAALIIVFERRRQAAKLAASATEAASPPPPPNQGFLPKVLVAPFALAVLLTTIFGFNYLSSGHEPIAQDMPFGLVGSSTLPEAAQGPLFSIAITEYDSADAATAAMDAGEIYGALIAGSSASPSQLTVVNSISDLSPLDIAANFERAAAEQGQTITVTPYAPTPLAPNDPFALVSSIVLVPLLVAGYMATTLLTNALGSASGRWRGVWLLGFAVVAAFVVDLIVTFGLQGLPADSFLIVWPIMALIIVSVALLTAVLRRIVGPVGIFLTVIIVVQFGNPSSGGANGVPYLPDFWKALGPFLPPRNAYELLRDTVYFGGNGTTQPLLVLLAYAVISAVILVAFDWVIDRRPSVPGIEDEDTISAAVTAPVGPLP